MSPSKPRTPPGLGKSGAALHKAITDTYELSDAELVVLRELSRTVDALDALQAQIDTDGVMGETSQGARVHPALVELRQQRLTVARLFTALRIPLDQGDEGRTPRRGGPRGVYGIKAS